MRPETVVVRRVAAPRRAHQTEIAKEDEQQPEKQCQTDGGRATLHGGGDEKTEAEAGNGEHDGKTHQDEVGINFAEPH